MPDRKRAAPEEAAPDPAPGTTGDIARPKPPGQELAHAGNVAGVAVRPAGAELATTRNANLATVTDLAR